MDELYFNPGGLDPAAYCWEEIAGENMSILPDIPLREQGAFPEGMDIEIGEIKDVVVEETGYHTPCRIYYPEGDGPFPFVFQIHGGAFYGGWLFLDEPYARQLSRDVKCAVVAPSYVLTPQFPYPASLYELYKAFRHFAQHAAEYNLKADKLVVSGGSAGANLAMAVSELAHMRGECHVDYGVFFYPVLTMDVPSAPRFDERTAADYMPDGIVDFMLNLYAAENDRNDPLLAPFHADMNTLPDFCMVSGRRDSLNCEFREFASRAMKDGYGDYIFLSYGMVPHGFLESDVGVEAARDSKAIICEKLKRIFEL